MRLTMHPYLRPLRELFIAHADPAVAAGQAAYMRNRFAFFGIRTIDRRSILRGFFKEHGHPPVAELAAIVRSAWQQEEREFHYSGMEMFTRQAKRLGPEYLELAGELILTNSWWDTVDHLAVHGVGEILRRHPSLIPQVVGRYMASGEPWLLRTALIFQLRYKENTDRELLFGNIEELAAHPDPFIRKAIGWALRQYARVAPEAVAAFVRSHQLSPLSVREAMKHL